MDLNAKKRILMFGLSSYPGGIENFAFNCFCREEFAKKFRIDFAVCDGGLAKRSEFLSAGHGEILLPNPKKDPRGYSAKVSELIENGGYDIVYVNMLSAANIIPVNIAAKKGVKSIVVHSHADSTVPGLLRKALHYINRRSCAKKATLRLACSEKAGKWIFGKRGFTVVPNAIDPDLFRFDPEKREGFRASFGFSENDLVIGHVGRIAYEKNHGFIIDILKELVDGGVDAKAVFVGDGNLKEEVVRKAKSLGLYDRTVFYGTSSETQNIYPAFDCFLFPSVFEGFGIAALEAQSCGVKAYCSDTLSPSLNVTGNVVFLPLGDAKIWADAVTAGNREEPDREAMNRSVRESGHNVNNQIRMLTELLNG